MSSLYLTEVADLDSVHSQPKAAGDCVIGLGRRDMVKGTVAQRQVHPKLHDSITITSDEMGFVCLSD